jgi:hypothetical protein
MARLARAEVFDPLEVSVVHCIHRCVRRGLLCGPDPLSGKNYEHRKPWLENRLDELAGRFGIDVLRLRDPVQSLPRDAAEPAGCGGDVVGRGSGSAVAAAVSVAEDGRVVG